MYEYNDIPQMARNAERCIDEPVSRFGVQVFHESMPDWCGPDFQIDMDDKAGLEIYRQFCHKMKEHYQTLINDQQLSSKTN
jgi:hypothetical protein